MKMKSVVASFDSFAEARRVVEELDRGGVPASDISIVANNASGDYRVQDESALVSPDDTAGTAGSNVVGGAMTGGVIGGATGLLVGALALAVPGIGPIVAAGPVAAALAGAGVGAVAGGLIGGLTMIGVNEDDAHLYAEAVRRGGAVVTVRGDPQTAERAAEVMRAHGAVDIARRAETWRTEGWSGRYDPVTAAMTLEDREEERSELGRPMADSRVGATTAAFGTMPRPGAGDAARDWGAHEPEFRRDWEANYQPGGGVYDDYLVAYRYGFETSANPRYAERDWDAIEPELRSEWERERSSHEWARFKDAVRKGWHRARTAVGRHGG